jgi:hypothetical protein
MVIPLSGRVPGRASGPSRSRIDGGGGLQYVSWKIDRVFRFSRRGEYIGGRATLGGGPGSPPPGAAGHGLAAPPYGVAGPWLPSISALDSVSCQEKKGTSAFVSSNSENISCVAFLKHKLAENRELALWHLVNRLVPENA